MIKSLGVCFGVGVIEFLVEGLEIYRDKASRHLKKLEK
jgi:hypothetical protein